MKKLKFPAWTVPPALLLICAFSYGLLASKLGFYWDDWPAAWFTKFYGVSSLFEVLGIDRPQLAWLYYFTNSLFGDSPLAWQIFSILMRWMSCLALWWTLRQIWPNHHNEVTWVTFLFALYPGFRQQYIALIYSHDWIIIALFFISLGLMIRALRQPRWFWPMMIASWLLAAYAMFADEYYFGLELLRPVLLYLVLRDQITDRRKRLRRVLILWLPYVGIMLLFLYWRLVLHVSPRGKVQILDSMADNPLLGILNLSRMILLDVLESGFLAWALPLNLVEVFKSGVLALILYVLFAAAVAVCVFIYLDRLQFKDEAPASPSKQWAKQALLIGVYALLIAGWPFWATSWEIGLTFPWDRFNLAMMFGACLALAGLVTLLFRRRSATLIALSIILGMSSASAVHLASQYQKDWELLQQFFWQLSWRAPAIAENTAVLTHRPPFTYATDNSLTAPLNWIYAPDQSGRDLPYLFWDVASHYPDGWNSLALDRSLQQKYRITEFDGSVDRAISAFYKPPNCVKVMDPLIDRYLPGIPLFITPGAAFSDPSLIETNPLQPVSLPIEIFGKEPEHGWCYNFEKAELARQVGDWEQVTAHADQALPLAPQMTQANVLEWIPFIEGYARQQRWEEASALSLEVYQVHPKMRRMLCALWARVQAATPASQERDQLLDELTQYFICSVNDND